MPRRWRSARSQGDAGLPIVLNAANEVAVAAFLDGRIGFTAIPDLICRAMDAYERQRRDGGRATWLTCARSTGWARGVSRRERVGWGTIERSDQVRGATSDQ